MHSQLENSVGHTGKLSSVANDGFTKLVSLALLALTRDLNRLTSSSKNLRYRRGQDSKSEMTRGRLTLAASD